MTINILYFARLAESLGLSSESVELPPDCANVAALLALLRKRGEPFASAFDGETSVMVALNQEMVDQAASINPGDEVAFFPPVTGG